MASEPATATAPFSPATLNALDVEASVTPCSAAASPAATNAVCRAPGRVSEAWISSEITVTPYRSASDPMRPRSAALNTRPVGLCGLASRYPRAPAANAASSPSKSSSQRPSPRASGTSTTRRPALGMCSKNGGYTGVLMTTPSPGSVVSSRTASTPAMTSGTRCTRPGSTAQSCRAAANRANASPSPEAIAYPQSDRSMADRSAASTGSARS